MDPLTFRYLQLAIAEVFGAALCGTGIYLMIRGLSGKSTFLMEGLGLKARITNASPGTVALIGAVIFVLSFKTPHVHVEEHGTSDPAVATQELEAWLHNARRVDGSENYNDLTNKILGPEPGRKFLAEHLILQRDTSLGEISRSAYFDERFWPLVAAINKDQGYYSFKGAGRDTVVKAGGVIEIWRVSKFFGKDTKTIAEISGRDRATAYREIQAFATKSGRPFDDKAFDELDQHYKHQELQLALTPANEAGGVQSIGDLSLKYYQDRTLWPIIAWVNPGKFPRDATDTTPLPKNEELFILYFL